MTRNVIPTTTSLDSLRDAAGIIDRAHQTAKVPSALLDRWDAAIEDTPSWQAALAEAQAQLTAEPSRGEA